MTDNQVYLGRIAADARNGQDRGQPFLFGLDDLCASALVVGPTGSGKTQGVARPMLAHILKAVGAGHASVLVIDPKGDDFKAGDYTHMIDIESAHSHGFALFGSDGDLSEEAIAAAADRLSTALLPRATDRTAYFISSSKNALYYNLAPYVHAHERWPRVDELLAVLMNDSRTWQSINDRLANKGLKSRFALHAKLRESSTARRENPAQNLLEAVGELFRPHIVNVLDRGTPRFAVDDLNQPIAVHMALPYAQSPVASRVLARLAISQFVQVCSARTANRRIYKFLVCDEASQYIDDYVVAGVRIVRSNFAGMLLLTQSLADIAPDLRASLSATVGNKFAFPGIGPDDAKYFSETWGTHLVRRRTVQTGESSSDKGYGQTMSVSEATVEEPVWSPSYLGTELPQFHAVVSRSDYRGLRRPARLVDLRH